ncbi:MAG: UDP-N-acetylmuramoyl-tripeptide--D-alanyl-D-alanine ligase [Candidatus Thiodiazotropha sp.]
MNSLSLSEVAIELEAVHQGEDVRFHSVSTDTRTIQSGDLFVALSGPNFDAHRFLDQAIEKGAVAAMVSELQSRDLPQLQVKNTRIGLGRLAATWRDRFEVPLVAITGSNGKTTVKALLTSILETRGSVLATKGNLNNEIGLPLSLLRLQDESCAVVEMGANHAGEIGYLSQIARPDVALINNAGAAHLEGFGNLAGVAHAKGEILSGLKPTGIGVLNADDRFFPLWRELCGERQMISFGISSKADVRSDLSQARMGWTEQGFHNHMQVHYQHESFDVQLALAGRHNLMNALAAVAAGLAMGCNTQQIQSGLAGVQAVAGRLCLHHTTRGYRLIDDSYNANPDSVDAAIEVLRSATGTRYLVLGDLAELGDDAESLHAAIGERAKQAGLEHLYTLGELSRQAAQNFGDGGEAFTELDQLVDALHSATRRGDAVLVKGSRSAGMDRVVERLMSMRRG